MRKLRLSEVLEKHNTHIIQCRVAVPFVRDLTYKFHPEHSIPQGALDSTLKARYIIKTGSGLNGLLSAYRAG